MFTKKSSEILVYSGLVILVIGFVLFIWHESYSLDSEIDASKIAQFGDFIGGVVGALWSLAGFILIYLAFLKQMEGLENQKIATEATIQAVKTQGEALKMQSQELSLQRTELEETRSVFKEQSNTMELQRFESTFFNMINLFNNIADNIDITIITTKTVTGNRNIPVNERKTQTKNIITGRDCFSYFNKRLRRHYSNNKHRTSEKSEEKILVVTFQEFYEENREDLGHYFNNAYQICKIIDSSKIENKKIYADIWRSQLSTEEMILILYLNFFEHKDKEFIDFLSKFRIFRGMNKKDLLAPEHANFFPKDFFEVY